MDEDIHFVGYSKDTLFKDLIFLQSSSISSLVRRLTNSLGGEVVSKSDQKLFQVGGTSTYPSGCTKHGSCQ